jgi:hypothetical protein
MNTHALLVRTRYRLRTGISHIPSIYLPLTNLRRRDEDGAKIVTQATDLVVEAFPRSGNTFTVTALQHSQPRRLNIAHHCHAPAQLIRAVRLRKPALLIVRQPKDAVLSFVLRHPSISMELGLKSWLHFHRALLPYLHGMVITTFDQVTSDLGVVVDLINRRFGTSLTRFDHTAVNVETCFAAIEARNSKRFGHGTVDELGVARPSRQRAACKEELEERWHAPRLRMYREAATSLHDKLASMASQ